MASVAAKWPEAIHSDRRLARCEREQHRKQSARGRGAPNLVIALDAPAVHCTADDPNHMRRITLTVHSERALKSGGRVHTRDHAAVRSRFWRAEALLVLIAISSFRKGGRVGGEPDPLLNRYVVDHAQARTISDGPFPPACRRVIEPDDEAMSIDLTAARVKAKHVGAAYDGTCLHRRATFAQPVTRTPDLVNEGTRRSAARQ